MKRLHQLVLFAAVLAMAVPAAVLHAENTTTAAPLAVISEPDFAFESVIEDTEVLHDYVIKNTGTAELTIEKVKTG